MSKKLFKNLKQGPKSTDLLVIPPARCCQKNHQQARNLKWTILVIISLTKVVKSVVITPRNWDSPILENNPKGQKGATYIEFPWDRKKKVSY